MNEDFIVDIEEPHTAPDSIALNGWESIRFEVEDEPPDLVPD